MQTLRSLRISILLLIAVSGLSAQWKPAAPNAIPLIFRPNNSGGVIMHHNGILWAGYRDIWMSADTGKSWSLRTPFDSFNNSCVKDIYFYDDNIGLATTQHGEIFITQNQGLSWTERGPFPPSLVGPSMESACFAGSPNTIIACISSGEKYASQDGGLTWSTFKFDTFASKILPGGGGNTYAIAGTISGGFLWETTDFGLTWVASGTSFNWDSYSFDRDQCDTSIFYVANDDLVAKTDSSSRIFVSTNAGGSWTVSGKQPQPFYCGSVTAASHAIFTQTFSGISRSNDHGRSWKDIGGPPNITDTRLVTALDNNVVVAIDSFGSVWVTVNSGGDSLIYTDGNTLYLQTSDQKTDTLGGTVAVPISIGGIGSPIEAELIVHYDPQLLYEGTYSTNNVKLDIPGEAWSGRSKIYVPGANSNGVLAHSYFGVFNDSLKIRSVRFDSLIFCLNYLPASATSAITPSSQCGADILSRYMRDSTPPQLRIVPNPAGSEIAIISSADLGEVTIGIYDMLGIEQRKMTVILEKNIPRRLGLSIPSGIYNLHLKSAAHSYDLRVAVNK